MQPLPAGLSRSGGRSSLPPSASSSTRRLPPSWADSPVVPDKRSSSTSDPWGTATSARKKVRAADWKGKGRADSVEAVGFSRTNGVFLGSSLPRGSLGRPRHSEPFSGSGRPQSGPILHPTSTSRGSQPPARSTPADYSGRRKSDSAHPPKNLRPVPEIGNQPTKIHSTRGPAPLDLLFGGDLPTQPPSRGSSTAPPMKEERPARPPTSIHPELFAPSKHPVPTFPKANYSHAPTRIRRPKSPPRFQSVEEVNKAQREALLKVNERYGPVAELRAKLEQRPAPRSPAESQPELEPEPVNEAPRGSPELFEGVEIPWADSADEECVDGEQSPTDGEMSDPAPSLSKESAATKRDSASQAEADRNDLCTPAERPLPLPPRRKRRPLSYTFPMRDIRHLDLDGEAGEVVANPLRRSTSVSSLASSAKDEPGKKDGSLAGPSIAKKQAKPKQVQRRDRKPGQCRSFVASQKQDEAEWYGRDYSGSNSGRLPVSRIAVRPRPSNQQLVVTAQLLTLPAAMCARLRSVGGRNYVTATFEISSSSDGVARTLHSTRCDLRVVPLSLDPLVEAGARAYQVLDATPFLFRLSPDQASCREQLVVDVSLDIAGATGAARRPLDALLAEPEHTVVLSNHSSLRLASSIESAKRDIQSAEAAVDELSARVDAIALNAEQPDGVWIPDPVAIRGHTAPTTFALPASVPGQVGFDFATKLPYNVDTAVPFLADETVEAMRPYFKANDEAITRTVVPLKEKLIARMQTRWCLVNPYPYTSYHRELACWRYYAPVVHHFSLRLELALHLVERLLRHNLLNEPQLREILHTYDREVKRIEAG